MVPRYTEETTVAVIFWYIVADVQATVSDLVHRCTIGEWGLFALAYPCCWRRDPDAPVGHIFVSQPWCRVSLGCRLAQRE